MFSINICILIGISWDGRIYWYETIIFIVAYISYFVVMFHNKKLMNIMKKVLEWNFFKGTRNFDETSATDIIYDNSRNDDVIKESNENIDSIEKAGKIGHFNGI